MAQNRAFKAKASDALNKEAFLDASRDELRVLIAIMANPLTYSTEEELAVAASVSRARAAAAVALFEEAGIVVREGNVSYEFSDTGSDLELAERSSTEVARTIRKKSLADLFSELASLMDVETLNTDEIKKITSLVSDLALTEDYILTLAAHLNLGGKLTVFKLTRQAKKLDELGIDTIEALDDYIKSKEETNGLVPDFRKMFGAYGRNIRKTELDFYRKWREVYAFSDEIISLALDITAESTSSLNYKYIDAILTRWHEAGCKTVAECKAKTETDRSIIAEEKKSRKAASQKAAKSVSTIPKYSNFDCNEALARALERSYGKTDGDKNS